MRPSLLLRTAPLLAGLASPLAAQIPKLPAPRSPCDFDKIVCEYSGVINVKNVEGGEEVIAASVTRGVVQCMVRYTDDQGTRSASGAGLIEISLGLDPDPDDSLPAGATRNSKLYTVRVACPNATYGAPREAAWSHSYDSYKRAGGDVGQDSRGQALPPAMLQGSYNTAYESGTGTVQMSWRLCRNCAPPPPPSLPPAYGSAARQPVMAKDLTSRRRPT